MKHFSILLLLLLCGCGKKEVAKSANAIPEEECKILKIHKFQSSNPWKHFSIDEIELEGRRYWVLHGREATQLMLKPSPIVEKP